MNLWKSNLAIQAASDSENFGVLAGTSLFLLLVGLFIYRGKNLWILVRASKNNLSKAKIQQQIRLARIIGFTSIWASALTFLGGLSAIKVASDLLHTLFVSGFIFSIVGPTIYLTQRR